jgi:hypothetical protein
MMETRNQIKIINNESDYADINFRTPYLQILDIFSSPESVNSHISWS